MPAAPPRRSPRPSSFLVRTCLPTAMLAERAPNASTELTPPMSTDTSAPTTSAPAGSRPTSVRHIVVAVTVLMAVILYLDRFCVSFAERYIKEDLGLSEREMAWFISAFFWAYAMGQVPSGWLGD